MRRATILNLLLIALLVAGCSALTPRTYQLEQIHATYTAEWARANFPDAGPKAGAPDNYEQFRDTLAAIANYKTTHGDTGEVAAHLTVLEGMIYLQSGKPGMARLLVTKIDESAETLKPSAGTLSRDYIFASCFEDLVDGWGAILKKTPDAAAFSGPASEIGQKLTEMPKENRPGRDVDSGGAFIATCAVIFYEWSTQVDLNTRPSRLPGVATECLAVLGPWLTEEEKEAARARAAGTTDWEARVRNDRVRYVAWYAWAIENGGTEPPEPEGETAALLDLEPRTGSSRPDPCPVGAGPRTQPWLTA